MLVVDDERSVRKLAQVVLCRYGYTVLVAEDAFEAVELLRPPPPSRFGPSGLPAAIGARIS